VKKVQLSSEQLAARQLCKRAVCLRAADVIEQYVRESNGYDERRREEMLVVLELRRIGRGEEET